MFKRGVFMAQQKLELTWYGKDNDIKVEPRLLIENPNLSYKSQNRDLFSGATYDNMLIHGDNLIALKSLEKDFTNKIKCIYIDPPYNTGSAFEHYDDNLEHSIWLNLMSSRLQIMKKLLKDDGIIFCQIDDNEFAYLSVLMDEIFGRKNFINMISVKAKGSSGASGGGEDRRLKKNVEYILVYAKGDAFTKFYPIFKQTPLIEYIKTREIQGINFAYKSVITKPGNLNLIGETEAGNGDKIEVYEVTNYEIKSISALAKEENTNVYETYYKYIDKVFTLENAQTSIRTRIKNYVNENAINNSGYYIARYSPITGKNKNNLIDVGFMGNTFRLVSYLKNLVEIKDNQVFKNDKIGTLWDDMSWSSVYNEGNVLFPNGKKPEALIKRIIEMSTLPGDLVLDSFLGSGTTIAVAHKMQRKWIGIELGDQALTHVKPRLDLVIDGDKSGISGDVNWIGGGGYKFYELAPSLIKVDEFDQAIINSDYNADMLASAIALHEGYKYEPDQSMFWKQAKNGDSSYLFTTTKHLDRTYLDAIHSQMNDDEFLVISCKSFESNIQHLYKNISIKKIPQSLLKNCEFGVDNYNLNIINPPVYEEDDEDE